ncbi:hypothetical protein AHAS_Ahas01G0190800 [Arachis hypogaea]
MLLSCFMVTVMEPASPSPMAAALTTTLFGSVLSCAALWVHVFVLARPFRSSCFSAGAVLSVDDCAAIELLKFLLPWIKKKRDCRV